MLRPFAAAPQLEERALHHLMLWVLTAGWLMHFRNKHISLETYSENTICSTQSSSVCASDLLIHFHKSSLEAKRKKPTSFIFSWKLWFQNLILFFSFFFIFACLQLFCGLSLGNYAKASISHNQYGKWFSYWLPRKRQREEQEYVNK